MTRMKKKYLEEVAPALMQKFQYKSVMQIPKIDKIVVSVGCGDCKDNAKALDAVIKDISAITGQHAVATVAKKSVANSFVSFMTISALVGSKAAVCSSRRRI